MAPTVLGTESLPHPLAPPGPGLADVAILSWGHFPQLSHWVSELTTSTPSSPGHCPSSTLRPDRLHLFLPGSTSPKERLLLMPEASLVFPAPTDCIPRSIPLRMACFKSVFALKAFSPRKAPRLPLSLSPRPSIVIRCSRSSLETTNRMNDCIGRSGSKSYRA